MSFWRLKREKEIKIRSKRDTEDLLIFLYNYLESSYDDVKYRENFIEFEIETTFHFAPTSGCYGNYTAVEHDDYISVTTTLSNPFAKAQNAFIMFASIFAGIVATVKTYEKSSFFYLLILPCFGVAVFIINAVIFQLTSYFRFQSLTKKVVFWADEVVEQ
jgi:hypothetical protein